MDFLVLFAIYVLVVLTSIFLVCKYSNQPDNPFSRLLKRVTRKIAPFTPRWLQSFSQWVLHSLFHQRNNIFIYLHILLEGAVYAEFSYEVFGFCREMDTTLISLSVPYVLLVIHILLFCLCIKTDPGTVTNKTIGRINIYPYDRKLFHPGVSCPTCHIIKPARSKHCSVCDRCVQRFDHHCVWVNNCIGAQNTRYFLLYLLSVCLMAGDIALLTGDMLFHVVVRSGLLRASYIDENGQQQAAGPMFVTQHIFLTFPRIVIMLGFLAFVFLLLAGYSLFHFFLVFVNQTSNEWYKSRGHFCLHCHPEIISANANGLCTPDPNHSKKYFYNRGLFRNLGEVFFPRRAVRKKHK